MNIGEVIPSIVKDLLLHGTHVSSVVTCAAEKTLMTTVVTWDSGNMVSAASIPQGMRDLVTK